ncbi:AAA family ATPase [Streptomyces sp. NPDC051940]|uniref:helix-turn-helix transcriptional regulator n=1 Tax=Streptomyces sp. NPDC051940 TaxID=3155675 RepID=UPI0034477D70
MDTAHISPLFAGRVAELEVIRAAFARAGAGEPGVVLVAGDAGAGKSRLVREFAARARSGGAVVAVGACLDQGAEALPFAPFAGALRALRGAMGSRAGEAAGGADGALARLLPELGNPADGDTPEPGDRTRLFEAAVRLLARAAADRDVVLVLEDLHWADRPTRELLGYLVRNLPPAARLLILATVRTDALQGHEPRRFLTELERLRGVVRRVELPPLTPDEVHAQLTGIGGGTAPERHVAEAVHRRSGGNPFLVEELAAGPGLTESLRSLLLLRVEALPGAAREVVRTAALDAVAEHDLLAAVAGLPEDALLDALRSAVSAGVLTPVRTPGTDGYAFRHALLREAVLDDLLPGDRRRLSRRYAEALAADPALVRPEERHVRLAGYWYHAREPERALPAILDAVTRMRERRVYDGQLDLLERALELWDRVPEETRRRLVWHSTLESYPRREPGAGPEYLDLLAETVRAAFFEWAAERGLRLVRQALRLIDEPGGPDSDRGEDPHRAAWFWMECSRLTAFHGAGDGRAELDRAHELVRDTPPAPVHADLLNRLASWRRTRHADAEAVELAERAVAYAHRMGAAQLELTARATLAHLRVQTGDPQAIAALYELREAAARADAPKLLGSANVNLTDALQQLGRSAEAVRAGLEGVEELSRRGLTGSASFTAANTAESLFCLGEWDRAGQLIAEWRPRALARSRASMDLLAARIAACRGDYDAVPALVAAARQRVGRLAEPQYELPLAAVEMCAAAGRGRHAEAFTMLDAALDLLPLPGQDGYVTQLLINAAQIAADTAGLPGIDPAVHGALLTRLTAEADRGLDPGWRALLPWLAAELAAARGADDPALWASAAAAFTPGAHPHIQARLDHRRAEALLRTGDPAVRDEAARLLTGAHALAVRLGAVPRRRDVEALAARARIPLSGSPDSAAPAPDPLAAAGLTAREREVLRLVADGRSNRQIAEELFISQKTASVHVSNMMAKLGASSRGEAAAIAHRLRAFAGD